MKSQHLDFVLNARKLYSRANEAAEIIKREFPEIDAIAVSGNSGTLMAGVISYLTGLEIILVRKENEKRYSRLDVEFDNILLNKKQVTYIILDDLISSGDTVNRINEAIKSEIPRLEEEIKIAPQYYQEVYTQFIPFKFVGIILYAEDGCNFKFVNPENGETINYCYISHLEKEI